MRQILAALVFTLVVAALADDVRAQSDWIKFSPEGGNFSMLMPVEPKTAVETTPVSPIGPYTTHVFTAVHQGAIFMAAWADYAPSVRLNVQTEINANRDNFIKGVKGTLVSEQKVEFAGYSGLEFTAQVPPDMVAVSKVIVVGNRPYQLIVVSRNSVDPATLNKFFSSFKLNSKK